MPITIEFLVSFAASLALVFILSAALTAQHDEILDSMKNRKEIAKAKQVAREIETWLNNGRISKLDYGSENITFRIEERLIISHNEKFIEVEGVFVNDRSEPV
jgi:hypothetical protein